MRYNPPGVTKALSIRAPVARVQRSGRFCRLAISAPALAERAEPGRIVTLLPASLAGIAPGFSPEGRPILLKRPFGIHRLLDPEGRPWRPGKPRAAFEVLVEAKGPSSRMIAALGPGDEVEVLGPLGRPLEPPPPGATALLVAGGIGAAPLLFAGSEFARAGIRTVLLLGVRDEPPVALGKGPARRLGDVSLDCDAPDFESEGVRSYVADEKKGEGRFPGLVTGLLEAFLGADRPEKPRVYACGPWPMMRAVAGICARRGIPDWHLLEEVMGCGIGICVSCIVPIKADGAPAGRRKVCVDGPAFRGADVDWEGKP